MKFLQKVAAAVLSALLLAALTVPALADTAPSEKEEVIYVLTDASGRVTDIEAVNIFAGGDITDYGDYSAVKMLNTNGPITQEGDKITISSSAARVYYQGTMKSTVIPWEISIRYFLDGREYSAQDIAGESGALEIRFTVSKNESCAGSFYEDYALQASFTLDTDRCKSIVSNGATVANVGSDKQLTYTILPGRGIDTTITAEVTDFEMGAVAINGVRLNLDVDVDDAELMDKVDELISAIGDLDDGAWELRDGTEELYDAAKTLNSKAGDLHYGAGKAAEGAGELYTGLSALAAKNSELTAAAYATYTQLCSAAAATVNAQLKANGMEMTVELTPETYGEVLTALGENLAVGAAEQGGGQGVQGGEQAAQEGEQTAQTKGEQRKQAQGSTVVQQIAALKAQLDSYGEFYQGLLAYTAAVTDAADGAQTLKEGTDTLQSGTSALKKAMGELYDGVGELYDGTGELTDGTGEFVDKTSDMDTQISNEIDSMTASFSGGDGDAVSFVSEKNTEVNAVQFVIKTAAIEMAEAATEDAVESAPLTLWQKLLRLFGL